MKVYAFFAVMILGFFGTITAIVRPDLVEIEYDKLTDPIYRYYEQRDISEWDKARQQAQARWMIDHQLPGECATNHASLKQLECRNAKDQILQAFNRDWQERLDSGWAPTSP